MKTNLLLDAQQKIELALQQKNERQLRQSVQRICQVLEQAGISQIPRHQYSYQLLVSAWTPQEIQDQLHHFRIVLREAIIKNEKQ